MICLRCGHCCTHLDVMVANPLSIRPDGTLDTGTADSVIFKPAGQWCPHLVFDGRVAVCKIHALACYRGCPCEQFEQIGRADDICVLGRYFEIDLARINANPLAHG